MSIESPPPYWYTGNCPNTHQLLQLPRTQEIEAIARHLMAELAQDKQFSREGKMYGVLLVETKSGEREIHKAFSGQLNGAAVVSGWVPPIPGRDRIAAAEAETLEKLAAMKQELIDLDRSPIRAEYQLLVTEFSQQLERLLIEQRQRKESRQHQRATGTLSASELHQLDEQSRQDGRERRQLKQTHNEVLQPLQTVLAQIDARIQTLRQQRKEQSRQLQIQMHDAYRLMNFLGTASSLRALMPAGIPTGTGDCCAPKLLHYAASHQLKPIAMAEFWWGESSGDKRQGEFYGACLERCQPLMGFMLSGLSPRPTDNTNGNLTIVYQDENVIAIDKPAGLLSVPGRSIELQDSVITRLRQLSPDGEIYPVHRLDRDTSGILLVARDRQIQSYLHQQFRDRQVHKVYEAILTGELDPNCQHYYQHCHILDRQQGAIDLPLIKDPTERLRQKVDFEYGKPSLTKFRVLEKIGEFTRIEFEPVTGRTHQIRVHAADAQGLGLPILGDRLYGCHSPATRLHLHARELSFVKFDRSTGHNIATQDSRFERLSQRQLPELVRLCVKAPF
jgi:tRNA pseudouridine32 synthase / 23S rRNA pseudouridine746 synthase